MEALPRGRRQRTVIPPGVFHPAGVRIPPPPRTGIQCCVVEDPGRGPKLLRSGGRRALGLALEARDDSPGLRYESPADMRRPAVRCSPRAGLTLTESETALHRQRKLSCPACSRAIDRSAWHRDASASEFHS